MVSAPVAEIDCDRDVELDRSVRVDDGVFGGCLGTVLKVMELLPRLV